jgi:hypothetical protein
MGKNNFSVKIRNPYKKQVVKDEKQGMLQNIFTIEFNAECNRNYIQIQHGYTEHRQCKSNALYRLW